MSAKVSFDTIRVGDAISVPAKDPISRLQLALFAGASGDHNPIHVDEDAAKAGGLPGCVAHGMLNMAFLGQLLTGWVPQSAVRSFSSRFTAMTFPGDQVTCRGVVTDKQVVDGENVVDLDIVAENQKGETVLAGTARVALP